MKSKKPTGLKTESPVTIHIPKPAAPPEEEKEVSWDEKHPALANVLHYTVIGVILLLVFLGGFVFIGWKSKLGAGLVGFLVISLAGGIAAVSWVIKTMTSNEFDKDDSGF